MKEDKNIDMNDAFLKQIRQKLANHTMLVDDDVWKAIQQKIAPPRRIIPWWVYIPVSAAAAIFLIFTVGNFMQQEDQIDINREVTFSDKNTVKEEHNTVIKSVTEDLLIAAEITTPVEKNTKHIQKIEEPLVEFSNSPIDEIAQPKEDDELLKPSIFPEEAPLAETETHISPSTILKEKLQELEADWTEIIKKSDDRELMLAAGVGSGVASSSATMPGRSRAYRHQSLVDMNTNTNRVLTPSDFNTKHYLPPVTVGVSVRLPLDKRFSLESGLLYTYLTTKLSGNTAAEVSAESNLHYLGLPLNLITSLLKENRWEIYVSTGATVEKGLRSEFRQSEDYGNTFLDVRANISVDGLQWSINASLGVAYHLNQNLSLYLDPKLSYYFENDQPFSIRSDMPLLVGLNTGLRMIL